ncbi:MAG TPA: c-type cytochrome [Kamptonema sp.]|nr:c-type cytochrome [Kamptonema sp.]
MKRLLSIALLAIAIFTLGFGSPALAEGNLANGAKIFSANCSACHVGGGNVVNPQKTLKKEALEKFSMNSVAAIAGQVTKGKNAMPAFKGRLNDQQIEDVAAYVLSQSDKNWSKS